MKVVTTLNHPRDLPGYEKEGRNILRDVLAGKRTVPCRGAARSARRRARRG